MVKLRSCLFEHLKQCPDFFYFNPQLVELFRLIAPHRIFQYPVKDINPLFEILLQLITGIHLAEGKKKILFME
jgi:hypothetical protein